MRRHCAWSASHPRSDASRERVRCNLWQALRYRGIDFAELRRRTAPYHHGRPLDLETLGRPFREIPAVVTPDTLGVIASALDLPDPAVLAWPSREFNRWIDAERRRALEREARVLASTVTEVEHRGLLRRLFAWAA